MVASRKFSVVYLGTRFNPDTDPFFPNATLSSAYRQLYMNATSRLEISIFSLCEIGHEISSPKHFTYSREYSSALSALSAVYWFHVQLSCQIRMRSHLVLTNFNPFIKLTLFFTSLVNVYFHYATLFPFGDFDHISTFTIELWLRFTPGIRIFSAIKSGNDS